MNQKLKIVLTLTVLLTAALALACSGAADEMGKANQMVSNLDRPIWLCHSDAR